MTYRFDHSWSAKTGSGPAGDVDIHQYLGETLYKGAWRLSVRLHLRAPAEVVSIALLQSKITTTPRFICSSARHKMPRAPWQTSCLPGHSSTTKALPPSDATPLVEPSRESKRLCAVSGLRFDC